MDGDKISLYKLTSISTSTTLPLTGHNLVWENGTNGFEMNGLRLENFDISREFGFLLENPLEFLPEYFNQWNELAKGMPGMVAAGKFREKVCQMALLDHSRLRCTREHSLAQLQLSMIASGYVWQDADIPKVLPACVAVPLWGVSKHLGIQPVLSHPGLFLANWTRKDTTRNLSLQNIRPLYSLPGGEEADWYICIVIVMEQQFAQGLNCIEAGVRAVDETDAAGLMTSLEGLRDCLVAMRTTFSQIHRLVSVETFYKILAPFLIDPEGGVLPENLVFEGVDEPVDKTGGETTILVSLDAFLGVGHRNESQGYLIRRRRAMPPGHRRFTETLESLPSTREFVYKNGDEDLKRTYNRCLSALTDFRGYHLSVVNKYFLKMAQKDGGDPDDGCADETGVDGLGYEAAASFLKDMRQDTKEGMILD